ncbi:MAG: hypothetical protein JRH15_15780 [Deltaproteobacteria bacterium]|nr:hypothetical protein [Deltaproteobacteria bacterium]
MSKFHKLVGAILIGALAALTNQTTASCDQNSRVGRHGDEAESIYHHCL